MLRIVKSELIKWFSGKMIYISMVFTAFLVSINYLASRFLISQNAEEAQELAEEIQLMSSQEYIVNSLGNLITGGVLFIIITIIIATLITEDYGRGTLKYTLLATSREKLMVGKIISSGIINFVLVMTALISSSIIGIIGYQWKQDSYSIFQIIMVCFLGWLTVFAFSSLLMLALRGIKKVSGAIALGIGIFMLIGLISTLVPESIKGLIIGVNFNKVVALDLTSLKQSFFSSIIYVLAFSMLNVLSFRNKEIE